jgi:transketolase
VYNFHTIKPFDRECAEEICRRYRVVFTIEEHNVVGGLGSAVAETFCELLFSAAKPVLHRLGIQDTFGESGTAEELIHKHFLDAEGISNTVVEAFNRYLQQT